MEAEEYVSKLLAKDERDAVSDVTPEIPPSVMLQLESDMRLIEMLTKQRDDETRRTETAERERDEALAREAVLQAELEAAAEWKHTASADAQLLAEYAALREACEGWRKRHWQSAIDCDECDALRDALAQPSPAAGKRLIDTARLEGITEELRIGKPGLAGTTGDPWQRITDAVNALDALRAGDYS